LCHPASSGPGSLAGAAMTARAVSVAHCAVLSYVQFDLVPVNAIMSSAAKSKWTVTVATNETVRVKLTRLVPL